MSIVLRIKFLSNVFAKLCRTTGNIITRFTDMPNDITDLLNGLTAGSCSLPLTKHGHSGFRPPLSDGFTWPNLTGVSLFCITFAAKPY